MKLDKLKFAQLVGWLTTVTGHIFDLHEVEIIDNAIDFDITALKVKASDIDELLKQIANPDGFIPAIKAYRALTGEGLKEAKEAVERYRVVNNSSDRSAKQIKNDMIDSLNREDCIIHPSNRNSVRDFVESFSHYK